MPLMKGHHTRLALALLAMATYSIAAQSSATVTVKDGIIEGHWVGSLTSQLQAVLDSRFVPVDSDTWQNVSRVNSSVLRYLILDGNYLADVPLRLPSLLVLKLNGRITPAANLSTTDVPRFTGLITLPAVHFSAVIGGTVDASGLPAVNNSRGYQAIAVVGGGQNAIRSLRAIANNSDSAIGVNESPGTEVSWCDIGGSSGAPSTGRCIWCLATSKAIIHHNHVHHCKSHALDFDAYTSASTAYSNVCEDCGEEGIFVEETASANFIFNNTCRRNRSGIGVYSNAVGPVASNMFIGNIVSDNGVGITAGGYGHDPAKYSKSNVFASNQALRNAVQFDPAHGAVESDYWVDNSYDAQPTAWGSVPANNSAVAIFEP